MPKEPNTLLTFKDFFPELYESEDGRRQLLEYECYRLIPGTNSSYREDPMNTSTKTEKHSHVYARPKGGGGQLYAVNYSGSGHDGSHDIKIPSSHADYFRGKGYKIPLSNIIECINIKDLDGSTYQLLFG